MSFARKQIPLQPMGGPGASLLLSMCKAGLVLAQRPGTHDLLQSSRTLGCLGHGLCDSKSSIHGDMLSSKEKSMVITSAPWNLWKTFMPMMSPPAKSSRMWPLISPLGHTGPRPPLTPPFLIWGMLFENELSS